MSNLDPVFVWPEDYPWRTFTDTNGVVWVNPFYKETTTEEITEDKEDA